MKIGKFTSSPFPPMNDRMNDSLKDNSENSTSTRIDGDICSKWMEENEMNHNNEGGTFILKHCHTWMQLSIT